MVQQMIKNKKIKNKRIIEKIHRIGYIYVSIHDDDDETYGHKYFLRFISTHKIVGRYKNLRDLEEALDILERGVTQ